MTDSEKNLLISSMENALEDAQAGAGVTSSLDEIETAIAALRTAYGVDPATVLAADLVAAIDMVLGCSFSSLSNISAVISAVRAEAA